MSQVFGNRRGIVHVQKQKDALLLFWRMVFSGHKIRQNGLPQIFTHGSIEQT